MIDRSERTWLTLILVFAILLRLAGALALGNAVVDLPGTWDQISYDLLAYRVATGHGFTVPVDWWPATRAGEPTAHWSYLYVTFLAACYWLFGHHPLVPRLIQATITGLLMPLLVYRLGQRTLGRQAGLVAAALTAVYAYFVYYSATLMTEPLYITAILWILDCGLRIADCGRQEAQSTSRETAGKWQETLVLHPASFATWFELGLAIGVAVLLRQVFLLFVPFLFAWLWWATKEIKRTSGSSGTFCPPALSVLRRSSLVVGLSVTVAVIVALITPWTVRNYRAFGRFVLLNTNAGFTFFWANHPVHGNHFIPVFEEPGEYQALIPAELRGLDEAALDSELLRRGLGFVLADPVRYLRLSLSRIGPYFMFWPSTNSGLISNIARVGSFGLSLPFMLYGLWLSAAHGRSAISHEHRTAIILLWLFSIVYTLIHLLSWTLIRYRLPVDAVLLIFAGLAIVHLWERLAMRTGMARPGTETNTG